MQPGCRSVLLPVLCSPDAAQPCCFAAFVAFCCFIVLLGGAQTHEKLTKMSTVGTVGTVRTVRTVETFYLGIYRVGAHVHPSALPQRPMCAPAGSQGTSYAPQRAPRAHHICIPVPSQGIPYAPQRASRAPYMHPSELLDAPYASLRAPWAPQIHTSAPPGHPMCTPACPQGAKCAIQIGVGAHGGSR